MGIRQYNLNHRRNQLREMRRQREGNMFQNLTDGHANITARIKAIMGVIERAAANNRRVAMTYRKPEEAPQIRMVAPETIWQSKAGDVLVSGRDAIRGDDVRTFRLDRVQNIRVSNTPAE